MRKLIIPLFLVVISSCTDVTLVTPVAGGPTISFVSIGPSEVREFKDSIIITIRYQDPDGDLGHQNPDIELLSVHDLRLEKADGYHVSLLAPPEDQLSIEGDLEVYLKNTFLLGTGDEERTSYELILTDRAGNKSNPLVTNEIKIIRQ
jgi:hypothetical protein